MSNVNEEYVNLLKEGLTKKEAAKIAQERTGVSLVSGKPINKNVTFTDEGFAYGQYRFKR